MRKLVRAHHPDLQAVFVRRRFQQIWLLVMAGLVAVSSAMAESKASLERKAEALLSQMTLEEKVGQMMQVDMNALKEKSDIKTYGIGSVLSGGGSDPADNSARGWAKAVEEHQAWAFRTRLKIPLLYAIDAVHGHNNVDGAVIFPHNIALGATRNTALVERAARVAAREVAATGIRWTFAPCVAVARDPRWGRTYESFGDMPELVEVMGTAAVRGFQGASLADPNSVLSCAKHFLGDGGTTNGKDQGNLECDEETLRRIHLPGYAAAVKAGVGSVMVSYSSWNGEKMHGQRRLINGLLKDELGFEGIVVSDWAAIDQLSGDYRSAIERSINAGLDVVMIPAGPGQTNNYQEFAAELKSLVEARRVPMERINDAARRVLRTKFKLGLFDEPFADRRLAAHIGRDEHRQVARECVRESLVLLKNRRHMLPLAKGLRRIHVAGRGADNLGMQCGGWTIDWQGRDGTVTRGGTTVLGAISQAAGPGTTVTFSMSGADAKGADVAIVVVGERPYAEMKGDLTDLSLAPEDVAAIEEVKRSGVPLVTIVLSGRPLILGRTLELSDSVMAAWLPGTEGLGIADVLFGDYPVRGKLPCAWPQSMEQVPLRKNTGQEPKPLFPYGYGLSYSTLTTESRSSNSPAL